MLKAELTPTRLVDAAERPPVIIVEVERPARYRNLIAINKFLKWAATALWLRVRGRLTRVAFARNTRMLLEDLGGLWIKVGQLLSFRVDIFSPEFCRELSQLQHQALGFPPARARRIVEEELGAPLEHYFDHWDEMPFAAASTGQIHRAHLRHEGVWVAVKVQRPHLVWTFSLDMDLIEWFVRFFKVIAFLPFMRWDEGLRELRQIMQEELDYRYEASAFIRMKKTLRKHNVYVPKLFSSYTRKRVLVMEYIQAVLMADYISVARTDPDKLAAWLQENNINPELVARQLIHSIFRQLFEDNLYHGDLHPGNIILLRNSRIALIDFGASAFTEREYLQRFYLFFRALATRDYSKAADLTFLLGGALPVIDLELVKGKLIEALRSWGIRTLVTDLPYHEKSLDNAFVQVTKIMFQYRCEVKWALLRIRRASATLDASLIHLFPDIDYNKLVEQYLRKAERRSFRVATRRLMLPGLIRATTTAMEVAESVYENAVYQGSVIRRQAQVFEGTTSKFAHFFAVLCGQIALGQFLAGLFFLMTFLYQHHDALIRPIMGEQLARMVQFVPHLDYQVWIMIIILDFYLFLTTLSLQRRFEEKDAREIQMIT